MEDTKINGFEIIDITPENIADYGICGYKDVSKHLELRRKIDWYKKYYPKGLRIKGIFSETGGYQGMIEYIPGEFAHRPVDAEGYLFVHCIFVGFKKEYKGQGFGSLLLQECIKDARKGKRSGVAVISRKGSFMAKRDIFIKNGFESVDKIKPDFELLSLKFDKSTKSPTFRSVNPQRYNDGLTIFRSAQCPYSVKNVDAILKTAQSLEIKTNLIEMDDIEDFKNVPSAFGSFCIIYNGRVISHHPISNTRFKNIIKCEL